LTGDATDHSAAKLMEVIKRPVAMNSNLHDAIFSPETLELWIADAGRKSAACDEPYAHFELEKLLAFYRDTMRARK
jgi:isopenicillin-N N-acyltransferase like protein